MKRFSLCALCVTILTISTLFTLCYTGCSKSNGDNVTNAVSSSSVAMQSSIAAEAGGYDEITATETAAKENGAFEEAEYSQKLTKTVRATLETKEYASLLKELETLLQQQGGYVTFSSMENQTGSGPSYANYTMKIPQEKLDGFLESLSTLGNISSMETQVEDITSPYYDTKTRLDSLAQQEQRLLELLDQTEDLQQILEIEDKLSYVRSDIEYINSILKTYENPSNLLYGRTSRMGSNRIQRAGIASILFVGRRKKLFLFFLIYHGLFNAWLCGSDCLFAPIFIDSRHHHIYYNPHLALFQKEKRGKQYKIATEST